MPAPNDDARIRVRISRDVHHELRERARDEDISIRKLADRFLRKALGMAAKRE